MAFEREFARCSTDHSWICVSNNSGSRMPTNGSRSAAGLALFGFTRRLPHNLGFTLIAACGGSVPGLLLRKRFKGITQAIVFDRSFRRDGTSAVLPMVIVTGNVHHPRSPWPSRFARSSRSWRWRHRPLMLHASTGFSGVPANQSIDREFLGNCHSQKRYSRPLVQTSTRQHAKKRARARHDQARPLRPWMAAACSRAIRLRVESGVTRASPCRRR
jgi:hypothetical protein